MLRSQDELNTNASIKLVIRAQEFVFRKVCRARVGVRVRKRTILEDRN